MNGYDREREHLEQQLADGLISQAEFLKEMRELSRDERADAEEEAQKAYDGVMAERYGYW